MSEPEKMLHVRVAEALTGESYYLAPYAVINGERWDVPTWFIKGHGSPDDPPAGWRAGYSPIRYDTDWAETGPLIEKYGINVFRYSDGQWEATSPDNKMGANADTPLQAVCHLILALKEAGKL